MAEEKGGEADFPCTLTIDVPFPSASLAHTALQVLRVDQELSPLVRRTFSTVSPPDSSKQSVLRTEYKATTNRMLRVAVNGFFESVGVVINTMKELDVDVYDGPVTESLEGVQGLVKG
ncbi:transcription factor Pcc1-domain-containing protein [Lophiotrema nucula]|uniref:Transcription factor Pcc1-domain-containing protein n=1 Tax=Lophiotrema nucula TaxID=690887 RepID=A0A6A5ZUF4_9PLEO|nr:transcription factor Pcc1-domain-containing protein [Lophiotrema nucula]